jgi:hypothetical protein
MSERLVIVLTTLMPHPIFVGIAVLPALHVFWWLPDWCLKVVVLVAITQPLHRSASTDATED